jgi:GNAT superfamily N-acetyltransferase
MSQIEIRKYKKDDAQGVKDLVERILKNEFPAESAAYPSNDLKDISGHYGKLGEAFFVAVSSDEIIGTAGVKREDERTALLRRLFVSSGFRGRQLGKRLVDRAVEFAREVGYEEMIFKTTSTMEKAVQLGTKKGFLPRARLNLGSVELLKFVLPLKGEAALKQ